MAAEDIRFELADPAGDDGAAAVASTLAAEAPDDQLLPVESLRRDEAPAAGEDEFDYDAPQRKRLQPSRRQQQLDVPAKPGAASSAPPPPRLLVTEPPQAAVPAAAARPEAPDDAPVTAALHAAPDAAQLAAAEAAWDTVNELRAAEEAAVAERGAAGAVPPSVNAAPLSYDAAVAFFHAQDLSAYRARIRVLDGARLPWWRTLLWSCWKPSLPEPLAAERDLALCLALHPMDGAVPEHDRLLQSLHRLLTGDRLPCPRIGAHWEALGFQGSDPATDLRGSGLLALLQLLSFLSAHAALALRIYQLSRDERQNFPFAVVSINLTGMTLESLREATLYGEMRRTGSVLRVLNALHAALFYEFLLVWKRGFHTIKDFDTVRRHLQRAARERPHELLAQFDKHNQPGQQAGAEAGFTELP